MMTGQSRFNTYLELSLRTGGSVLALALVVTMFCGCRTHKNDKDKNKDKELASLRIHIEASPGDPLGSVKVPIYRANPIEIEVEKEPFLTESDVQSARVVNVLGGFDLLIQLNRQGTWMLEDYSASNSGRHFAVFSQFGEKSKQTRWLAAPIFTRLLTDGILQFTPDASREETEEIARGLNNFAKKSEQNDKW